MQQLRTQCERKRLEELVTGKPAQGSPNPVPAFNPEEYKKTLADWNYSRNAPPQDKPPNYGEKVPLQKLTNGGFVMKRNERSQDLAQNAQKGRSNEMAQMQQGGAVERSRDLSEALQKDANDKSPARTDGMSSQIDPTKTNNEVSAKVIEWMTEKGYNMVTYERSPEEMRDGEEDELNRADQITNEVIEKLRDKRNENRKEELIHQTINEVTKGHMDSTKANEQVQNVEKVTGDKMATEKRTNKEKPRKYYDVRTNVPHRIDKLSEILKGHSTPAKGQVLSDMDPGPVSLIPVKCKIHTLKIQNGKLPKRIEAYTHEVKVGDIKVNAMLDTGAETSLISKPFCEKNGLHMLPLPPDRLVKINGISGTSGFLVTHYCVAPVTLRKKTSEHSFYVRPKCDDVQVLLGFDFLEKKFVLMDNEGEEEKEDDPKPVAKVQVGKVTELAKQEKAQTVNKALIPVPEAPGNEKKKMTRKELSPFEQLQVIQQEIEKTLNRTLLTQKGREKVIPVPEAPGMTKVQQEEIIPVPEALETK
ncbi:uncharacterized protein LOC129593150 [Paramacrobiotus metropolitanus]|uniref:uncharacterized protein LOC129593150 n=1 Tax=Paramacrobiotus metropolitanus TaxID=2943436 RepID=UPI00244611D9|nr:uncharacterized protein LOC129593150 [Paramacrobiotus metropolitanus]